MPIYEYYSPDTNRIYSFYAKTLAHGKLTPKCPDDPKARMVKLLSSFAVVGSKKQPSGDKQGADSPVSPSAEDARMEAAMGAMEREFSNVDESDPRAMARMMRRMAELSGEKMDGPMEEAVRRLEEGADPDTLDQQLDDAFGPEGERVPFGGPTPPGADADPREPRARPKTRRLPPQRDPRLYDYE